MRCASVFLLVALAVSCKRTTQPQGVGETRPEGLATNRVVAPLGVAREDQASLDHARGGRASIISYIMKGDGYRPARHSADARLLKAVKATDGAAFEYWIRDVGPGEWWVMRWANESNQSGRSVIFHLVEKGGQISIKTIWDASL